MPEKQFKLFLFALILSIVLNCLAVWQIFSLHREVSSLSGDVTEMHNKLCPDLGGCSGL